MSSEQIVLFDLPTRPPRKTWSHNPWKTRLLLAYKGLDFRTEWLEYPDIKPRLQEHVPPDPTTGYTIPTILLPDGTYVMDSRQIADVINARHPQPPLKIDTKYLDWFNTNYLKMMGLIRGTYIPVVHNRLLDPYAQPYFRATREKRNGMTLEELEKDLGGESAWTSAAPLLEELTGLLKENEGPFFEGTEVTYADFVWAAALLFFQTVGGEVFQELLKASGDARPHLDLLEAVRPWSERRD